MIKVLSIDGGGIRGMIPAVLLNEVEKRTGKKIAEMFDLIAGTSTGGILSLGLVKTDEKGDIKYTARELVDIYEKRGEEIFPNNFGKNFKALYDEKYNSKGIEKVLEEYFGEDWLSDVYKKGGNPIDVLITAYEIERRDTWFFKSRNAAIRPDYNFKLKDVARSTSAAPTYFEPAQILSEDKTKFYMVDGGVYANNPAMCAYIESQKNFGSQQDILLVSLGTGDIFKPIPYEDAKGWGAIEWVKPIIDMMFDGTDNVIHNQLSILFKNKSKPSQYFRFQREIQNEFSDMDNAKADNISYLRGVGQRLILENSSEIDEVCELLVKG